MATQEEIDFIRRLPKAELHVHIEGTLEPELMFKLAERNKIEIPYKSVEEVRAAYQFSNLQDFLDIYYAGAGILQKEQGFYDLAAEYFEHAAADGVVDSRIFFDPQTHTDRGISYDAVIQGLVRAAHDAAEKFDITFSYVHSFLRHLTEEAAFESLAMAEPYLDDKDFYRIVGVGLDSSEVGNPPKKFARVIAKAVEMDLEENSIHAAEEGPPKYVRQALKILKPKKADRKSKTLKPIIIDHGNRAMEDPALVASLREDGVVLTVCPLSNLKLRVVTDISKHPIRKMLDAGLKATINSDDPAYFGGYIVDNFVVLLDADEIDLRDCVTLARNSIEASNMGHNRKMHYLDVLQEMEDSLPLRPVAGAGGQAPRLQS